MNKLKNKKIKKFTSNAAPARSAAGHALLRPVRRQRVPVRAAQRPRERDGLGGAHAGVRLLRLRQETSRVHTRCRRLTRAADVLEAVRPEARAARRGFARATSSVRGLREGRR